MARATITRQWGPDNALEVEVELEESFPDAVAEGVAAAANLFTKALAIEETFEAGDD